jgi:hypothetical protein
MSIVQSFRFALWFAYTDLWGRWQARYITLANLLTVVALTAFTLLVYGLVLGTDRRRMEQIRQDPLAACLVVRLPTRSQFIQPEQIRELEQKVRAALVSPEHLEAIAPFHVLEQDWFYPNEETSPNFRGRTLADNDPLFKSFSRSKFWAKGPPAPGQQGVVLTLGMLGQLGLRTDTLPDSLVVRTGVGKRAVPIVGVLNHDIPGRREYLLPEGLWNDLQRQSDVPNADEVRSGILPQRWSQLRELPADVLNYLSSKNIEWDGRRPFEQGHVWLFHFSPGEQPDQKTPPRLDQWQIHLENVARRLVEKNGPGGAFVQVQPLHKVERPGEEAASGYDRVTLYFRDLDDLPRGAEAARKLGLVVDEDLQDQIDRIRSTTSRLMLMVTPIILAVAVLGIWNLCVIQYLQAHQKVPEVGMLKATGLSDGLLKLIYLIEAFLLWGAGLTGGLVLGRLAGMGAELGMAWDNPETVLAFELSWPWWLTIAVGSGLLCLGSTLVTTARARRDPPVKCLSAR